MALKPYYVLMCHSETIQLLTVTLASLENGMIAFHWFCWQQVHNKHSQFSDTMQSNVVFELP